MTDSAVSTLNSLGHGKWTESYSGGMLSNPDPLFGGIVDSAIVTGEWFIIFNAPSLKALDGFPTREKAAEAFAASIPASN
ncbi:hypothetical protein [Xanthobacter aminoxidans]|uniref:Uncharacterized protein n=1 Tax=Xanthobacter aminoxidans TaxID=186280 RepID=A0ABW6ZNG4_9HYPH